VQFHHCPINRKHKDGQQPIQNIMSKQSEAKAAQGYTEIMNNCGNCKHFQSERFLPDWKVRENRFDKSFGRPLSYNIELHGLEKNFRCGIGGFKAKKTAFCIYWEIKDQS
jgi:hypothetical protein